MTNNEYCIVVYKEELIKRDNLTYRYAYDIKLRPEFMECLISDLKKIDDEHTLAMHKAKTDQLISEITKKKNDE